MPGDENHRAALKLLEEGRTEEAIHSLEEALSEQPTAERWNDWAVAQSACDRADKAEDGFRRALAVDAADGQAALNLGVLLATLGREQEALPFLKQAAGRVDESQRAIIKEVLATCSRKAASDTLARSQAAFQDLLHELHQSWPLAPPPPSALLRSSPVARPLPIWDDNPEFDRICRNIGDHTTLDRVRCYVLYQFAMQASQLPGNAAEVGVYKGGSARLLSQTIAPRARKTVHLFDTFTGMPATDPSIDLHNPGDFADTSLEAVRTSLRDCRNLRFYQGFFPDTAAPIKDQKFCLVHVDVDIYPSVRDSCRFFYPRMVRGGIMLFDDYGFDSCPGARKAVDEFFVGKPEHPFYLPTGQCFVIREREERRARWPAVSRKVGDLARLPTQFQNV
jgi:O-methyltransferase